MLLTRGDVETVSTANVTFLEFYELFAVIWATMTAASAIGSCHMLMSEPTEARIQRAMWKKIVAVDKPLQPAAVHTPTRKPTLPAADDDDSCMAVYWKTAVKGCC